MARAKISPNLGFEEGKWRINSSLVHVNLVHSRIRIDVRELSQSQFPAYSLNSLCSIAADTELLELSGRLVIHQWHKLTYSLLSTAVEVSLYRVAQIAFAKRSSS
jgi:hypothetical protein